jgi:hypothetical protein
VGCVGGVEVWALWGCGVTPYVRHSTDCTCCDFGHLRFYKKANNTPSGNRKSSGMQSAKGRSTPPALSIAGLFDVFLLLQRPASFPLFMVCTFYGNERDKNFPMLYVAKIVELLVM